MAWVPGGERAVYAVRRFENRNAYEDRHDAGTFSFRGTLAKKVSSFPRATHSVQLRARRTIFSMQLYISKRVPSSVTGILRKEKSFSISLKKRMWAILFEGNVFGGDTERGVGGGERGEEKERERGRNFFPEREKVEFSFPPPAPGQHSGKL